MYKDREVQLKISFIYKWWRPGVNLWQLSADPYHVHVMCRLHPTFGNKWLLHIKDVPVPFFSPSGYWFQYPNLWIYLPICYQCIKNNSIHISFDFPVYIIAEYRYFASSVHSLHSSLLLKTAVTSGSTGQLPQYGKNWFQVCNVSQSKLNYLGSSWVSFLTANK